MRYLFSSSRKELSRSEANMAYVRFALSLRRSCNGGSAEVAIVFGDVVGCCHCQVCGLPSARSLHSL